MMQHWITLPILWPLLTGVLLIFMAKANRDAKRLVSLTSVVLAVPMIWVLLQQAATGDYQVYAVGNWQPPFGIVLVLDRLAALMLMMTAVLAALALFYAIRGDDKPGQNFHPLFHFQLVGIQGAFLTGDIFNLFVFFEILLISSYGLLMHGAGPARTRATLHYVILNLTGSALFLIGVGTLYGVLGTLNMADMVLALQKVPTEDMPLVRAGGLILLMVFGLKAAMLPLYFWLPNAYSSASPSVASLFAIMTKVGVYSILRVHGLMFGSSALAGSLYTWLWPLAALTIVFGAIGVMGARSLKRVVSYLVIVSVGTLLIVVASDHEPTLVGGLYYLIHSTFITAALYLLADIIAGQRGARLDTLLPAPAVVQPRLLGVIFFVSAASVAGLPPLSGFIGKALILQGSTEQSFAPLMWLIILSAGLVALISLSRAGSTIFWRVTEDELKSHKADTIKLSVAVLLLLISPILAIFGEPVIQYVKATAAQVMEGERYVRAVLNSAQLGGLQDEP